MEITMKRKVQRSKRAREEEKIAKTMRYMGIDLQIRHKTSHVSGGRGKHSYLRTGSLKEEMINNIIRRA